MNNLKNTFKHLKSLEPSSSYTDRSKRLILISNQEHVFHLSNLFFNKTLALTGGLLVIIIGTLISINLETGIVATLTPTPTIDSLNAEEIREELKDFNLNIQIGNAQYYNPEGLSANDSPSSDEINDILEKISL